MRTNDLLQGMYYPYADLRPSQALLEACLYLDRIYILEPNFFVLPDGDAVTQRVPSAPSMQPLLDSGVIEPIGPSLLGVNTSPWHGINTSSSLLSAPPLLDDENLLLLRSSISQDLADQEMKRMAAASGFVSWAIPSGQQLFWNGLGLLLERQRSDILIHTDRLGVYRKLLADLGYGHQRLIGTEKRIRNAHGDLQIQVPFLEAESLMLTVALLASSEMGLYPITDSALHESFLRRKIKRIFAEPELRDSLRPIVSATREAELGLQTIRIGIPRLMDLNAESVVRLREECRDSLERFRSHLRALSFKIESTPWSANFDMEIQKILSVEIKPALDDLRGQLSDKAHLLKIRLATAVVKGAPLPLLITLATGLPPEVTLAAGVSVTAVGELATYLVERRPLRRNGLYFLLDAKL